MKKTTVTIGIPAFNEEQNIKNILLSLFEQRFEKNYLEKVLVNSDASTDKTNEIVKKLSKKYPKIILLENKSRKGKYFRVNELFKKNKSDAVVILDADIALVGEDFIERLVQYLLDDSRAVMATGHNVLIPPKGFVSKLLYTHFMMWDLVRLSMPDLNTAENFYGTATAYKKSFARTINITPKIKDPHLYLYLMAKKVNGFRYSQNTEVLQYAAATINDLRKIMHRTIGKKDEELEKIFGQKMVNGSLHLSKRAKIVGIWKCFLKEPFYTPLAILFSFYIRKFMRPKKIDVSPIWEINTSTKKPIIYAK